MPERFIVVPDHRAGDAVAAVADRIFVVESARRIAKPQRMPAGRAEEEL